MKSFKVLQFNMQFGQRWDEHDPDRAPIDLDLTIAEIRAQDADIVLLQEVEQAHPEAAVREPPRNYARLCAALEGYDGFFSARHSDPRELPFGIGLAIFSKTKLRDTARYELPSPPIEFEFKGETKTPTDRLLIGATTIIGGRDVRLLNTHLLAFFMLNSSSEEHPQQRALVLQQLRATNGAVLLGGDFNVSRHEALVRQFADAGFATVQKERVTWRRRPYVLDHIFYSTQLRPLSHAVRPTAASDHHMLIAEFSFVD